MARAGTNLVDKIRKTPSIYSRKKNTMEISLEKINDSDIISVKGRLDVTTTAELDKTFSSLFESGGAKILVDCAELEYISSAGLRTLLAAAKNSKKQNGKIVLACLNRNVRQIFEISGFTQIFDIFDSRESALSAL